MSTIDIGVTQESALPGRSQAVQITGRHAVLGSSMIGPFSDWQVGVFAMGCFWGAERIFWQLEGVQTTAVGYTGGFTQHPTYEEVCSGRTGHTEAVLVGFDAKRISYDELLQQFWESHDPTQGMRQGNDRGSQYRSGIYTYSAEQRASAEASRRDYQRNLLDAGHGEVTTELCDVAEFFYAEEYHQQYLHKNPGGYCGIGGTGVSCSGRVD